MEREWMSRWGMYGWWAEDEASLRREGGMRLPPRSLIASSLQIMQVIGIWGLLQVLTRGNITTRTFAVFHHLCSCWHSMETCLTSALSQLVLQTGALRRSLFSGGKADKQPRAMCGELWEQHDQRLVESMVGVALCVHTRHLSTLATLAEGVALLTAYMMSPLSL